MNETTESTSHGAWPPQLLMSRPPAQRAILVIGVAAAFGALTGWLLGVSEVAWIICNLVAALGGFGAGLEHRRPGEAAVRGLIGGASFGAAILIVHEITGDAEAHLPEPPIVLAAFTTVLGAILGALGTFLVGRRIHGAG